MDKEFVKELHKDHVRRFRTIYNDLNELIDIESTYKDILTSQIEIYMSSVSNSLNIVMKKLTALASFVLILEYEHRPLPAAVFCLIPASVPASLPAPTPYLCFLWRH